MFERECIGQFHHEMERELCWANLTFQDMSNFEMYGLQNQLGMQIQDAACTILSESRGHMERKIAKQWTWKNEKYYS